MSTAFRFLLAVVLLSILLCPRGATTAAQNSVTRVPIAEFVAQGGSISRTAIAPDDTYLVTMGTYILNIWDLTDPSRLPLKRAVRYPDNVLQDFKLNTTGDLLAYLVAGDDNMVVFMDPRSGRRIDPRNGQRAAGSGNSLANGYWKLEDEKIPESLTAIHLGQPGASVAVAYAFGGISHLDIDTGRSNLIETDLHQLWDVEFVTPERLTWAGPYGIDLARLAAPFWLTSRL